VGLIDRAVRMAPLVSACLRRDRQAEDLLGGELESVVEIDDVAGEVALQSVADVHELSAVVSAPRRVRV
jgi:hypothetical protein